MSSFVGKYSTVNTEHGYHVVSRSKNPEIPGLPKHWHKKRIITDNEDVWGGWFRRQLRDSYLSRIMHKILPHAPKGKFNGTREYVSRLYPLDGHTSEEMPDIRKLTLYDVITKPLERLDGLLESLVFSIIINDTDCKLDNFAAYPDKREENVYKVGAFDFEYAFNCNTAFGGEEWTEKKLESLVNGADNLSKNNSVAEALLETVGHFGKRNTAYYRSSYPSETVKKFDEYMPKFKRCLENELSAINENHSLALLQVFKTILGKIKAYEPKAREETHVDILLKSEGIGPRVCTEMMGFQQKLSTNVRNVENYIDNIGKRLFTGVDMTSVRERAGARAGAGAAGAGDIGSHVASLEQTMRGCLTM